MTDDTTADGAGGTPGRPFADFLREQGKGRVHDELTEALAGLIEAVQTTGKAGSLVLTLKLRPYGKTLDGRAMVVQDDITVRPPTLERPESLFFVDHGGRALVRNDPEQLPLTGLQVVTDTRKAGTP